MSTNNNEENIFDEMLKALQKGYEDAILFADKHPKATQIFIGFVSSLATVPLSGPLSVGVGVLAAFTGAALEGAIHKEAENIMRKRDDDAEKSSEDNLEQPLNKGRSLDFSTKNPTHNHHAEDLISRQKQTQPTR